MKTLIKGFGIITGICTLTGFWIWGSIISSMRKEKKGLDVETYV